MLVGRVRTLNVPARRLGVLQESLFDARKDPLGERLGEKASEL